MPSDSNYSSVARYTRQPLSKAARPVALHVVDESWAADKLSDDEVEITRHEAAVAPLLEEGELDADAIVVSSTGNSASAANNGKSTIHNLLRRNITYFEDSWMDRKSDRCLFPIFFRNLKQRQKGAEEKKAGTILGWIKSTQLELVLGPLYLPECRRNKKDKCTSTRCGHLWRT